jgi:hypothetical protein
MLHANVVNTGLLVLSIGALCLRFTLRVVIDRKFLPPAGSRGGNARNSEKVKPQE